MLERSLSYLHLYRHHLHLLFKCELLLVTFTFIKATIYVSFALHDMFVAYNVSSLRFEFIYVISINHVEQMNARFFAPKPTTYRLMGLQHIYGE